MSDQPQPGQHDDETQTPRPVFGTGGLTIRKPGAGSPAVPRGNTDGE